jgi:hypothetical protein
MTVLMPIFGYFILFGDFTSDIFSIVGERLGLDQEEAKSFSIGSLYFIYFGVLIFSISTIVYNIFCPDAIKSFSNRYEFFAQESDVMTRGRAEAIARELKEQFKREITLEFDDLTKAEAEDNLVDKGAQKLEKMRTIAVRQSRDHWIAKYSGPVLDLLHMKYDLYDTSRWGIRAFVFYTYIFSTLLIALPTLKTIGLILLSLLD